MAAKLWPRALTGLLILAAALPLTVVAQDLTGVPSWTTTSQDSPATTTAAGEDIINRCQIESPCDGNQDCDQSLWMSMGDCASSVRMAAASSSIARCKAPLSDIETASLSPEVKECICAVEELVAQKCMCIYCNASLVKSWLTLIAGRCGTPTAPVIATCATTTFPVFAPAEQTTESSSSTTSSGTGTGTGSSSAVSSTQKPAAGIRQMGLPVVWCVVPVLVEMVLNGM